MDNMTAKELYELGEKYYYGKGVPTSYEKAFELSLKAAKMGYAPAQTRTGFCYEHGHGVSVSYSDAVYWYTLAAGQGFAQGQYNLAVCYDNGIGVTQSSEKAVEWYLKAAEQGQVEAMYNVAFSYRDGQGVPRSTIKSLEYFAKASAKGMDEAYLYISAYIMRLSRGTPIRTDKDLFQAGYQYDLFDHNLQKALECWTIAAYRGNADAQYYLGKCYKDGRGVEADLEKGCSLIRMAEAQGQPQAIQETDDNINLATAIIMDRLKNLWS